MRALLLSALALVAVPLFSGCDAVEEGGVGSTANVGTISGPSSGQSGCTYRYELYTNARPGDWSIDRGSLVNEGYDSGSMTEWADFQLTGNGNHTISWTSGALTETKVTYTLRALTPCP